jgi:hypothetical protein
MFEIICFTCGEFNFDDTECDCCGSGLRESTVASADTFGGQTANVA